MFGVFGVYALRCIGFRDLGFGVILYIPIYPLKGT